MSEESDNSIRPLRPIGFLTDPERFDFLKYGAGSNPEQLMDILLGGLHNSQVGAPPREPYVDPNTYHNLGGSVELCVNPKHDSFDLEDSSTDTQMYLSEKEARALYEILKTYFSA